MTKNKEILEKANAALKKGNIEGFLSSCTEDTVWEFIGDKTLVGIHAVREYLNETYSDSTDFTIELMTEDDDYVMQMGEILLKDDKGEMTNYLACDVWKFREGKMAELKAFVIKNDKKIEAKN